MESADAAVAAQVQAEEDKLPLLWGAITVSVVVYAAVAFLIAPRYSIEFTDRELRGWLLMFLAMSAGLHILTALLLRQILASFTRGRYLVYCMLRWSLMDGIGVYGLICAFLGVDAWIHAIFYVISLALLLGARPGGDDRAIFVRQYH